MLAVIGNYIADDSDAGKLQGRCTAATSLTRPTQLEVLRAGHAECGLLIELVAVAVTCLSSSDLRSLLRSMGEPYTTIADHGRNARFWVTGC